MQIFDLNFKWSWVLSLVLHLGLLVLLIFNLNLLDGRKYVVSSGNEKYQKIVQATLLDEKILSRKKIPVVRKKKIYYKKKIKKTIITQKHKLLANLAKEIFTKKKQKKIKQKKELLQQKILNAKALQKQLLHEKIRVAALKSARTRGEVNKYRALILQVIAQNWRVPVTPNKKLVAELLIHLAPGGEVLDVKIAKSSGNSLLDKSARLAVLKSSPLPVPSDSASFSLFRNFLLKVTPERIIKS